LLPGFTAGQSLKGGAIKAKKYLALFANSEYNRDMILKPQDIFILLKIVSIEKAYGLMNLWLVICS